MSNHFLRCFQFFGALSFAVIASGCFFTESILSVGVEKVSLQCKKVIVQDGGDLAIEASLRRGRNVYRRYLFVEKEQVLAAVRNEQNHWSTPSLFSVCPAIGDAKFNSAMYPNNFDRRNAQIRDLPKGARVNWPSGSSGQSSDGIVLDSLNFPYAHGDRSVMLRISAVEFKDRSTTIVSFWHYPVQLLLPAAIALDILIFPIQILRIHQATL